MKYSDHNRRVLRFGHQNLNARLNIQECVQISDVLILIKENEV